MVEDTKSANNVTSKLELQLRLARLFERQKRYLWDRILDSFSTMDRCVVAATDDGREMEFQESWHSFGVFSQSGMLSYSGMP
jgi:hypothetical protein